MGREDNIAEESTLLFWFFLKISLLSPTCWLWRRDNDEVDAGDDDQRHERTTSLKNVCWLYYLSVVFFFWLLSLCCLPHVEGQ